MSDQNKVAVGSGMTPQEGFFDHAPASKPTVTGAKGSNAALGSLIAALVSLGLINDSTSA